MEFFFLNPNKETYLKIKNDKKLKNELGDIYDIWIIGVIATYGDIFNESDEIIGEFKEKFNNDVEIIKTKLIINPSGLLLNKCWQIFHITGDYNALELCFETAGNIKAKPALRDNAIGLFKNYKEQFMINYMGNNINNPFEILDKNIKKYEEKKKEDTPIFNFETEQLKQEIKKTKKQEKQERKKMDKKIKKKQENNTEEIKEKQKAIELFDKLSVDIFNKIRF